MPSTFDLLHLILAIVSLVFLIVIVVQRKTSQAAAESGGQPVPAPATIEKSAQASAVQPEPAVLREASPDAALQLLSLLQQEARFIDFVKEDLSSYSDEDIGAAARVVHEGSKKTLDKYFTLEAICSEAEESSISLPEGFNASQVRLTGNVVGEAPFTGILIHKGWKVSETNLPKTAAGHDATIIAPAEVEL